MTILDYSLLLGLAKSVYYVVNCCDVLKILSITINIDFN